MTVYIVFYKNFHSENEFTAIFSTEETAQAYIDRHSKEDRPSLSIEPYELDSD